MPFSSRLSPGRQFHGFSENVTAPLLCEPRVGHVTEKGFWQREKWGDAHFSLEIFPSILCELYHTWEVKATTVLGADPLILPPRQIFLLHKNNQKPSAWIIRVLRSFVKNGMLLLAKRNTLCRLVFFGISTKLSGRQAGKEGALPLGLSVCRPACLPQR
jgi:hypothetical protein